MPARRTGSNGTQWGAAPALKLLLAILPHTCNKSVLLARGLQARDALPALSFPGGCSAPRTSWPSSAVDDAILCSVAASSATVLRTCAMSSCKAVLSIAIPQSNRQSDDPESQSTRSIPEG